MNVLLYNILGEDSGKLLSVPLTENDALTWDSSKGISWDLLYWSSPMKTKRWCQFIWSVKVSFVRWRWRGKERLLKDGQLCTHASGCS